MLLDYIAMKDFEKNTSIAVGRLVPLLLCLGWTDKRKKLTNATESIAASLECIVVLLPEAQKEVYKFHCAFFFLVSFVAVGIKDFILSIVDLEIALGKTVLLNQMKWFP